MKNENVFLKVSESGMGIAVSIIIPVFNVEKYVKKTLESAMNQTLPNVEIICVNDGSEDDSWRVVSECYKIDKRIKLIDLGRNYGLSYARNIGIENARGEYVLFLDSDDTLNKNAAEVLYTQAQKDQAEIVFYDANYEYENEHLLMKYKGHKRITYCDKVISGLEIFKLFYNFGWPLVMAQLEFCNLKFLKDNELFFQVGIFHEDDLFFFKTFILAKKVRILNRCLYRYLRRENSITTMPVTLKHIKSRVIIYSEALQFFMEKPVEEKYYNAIGKWFALHSINKKHLSEYSRCNDMNEYETEYQKKIYCILCEKVRGKFCRELSTDEISVLKNNNTIVLYGAGIVAQEAIGYLDSIGICNFMVAVTKAEENQYLFGNKVYSLEDVSLDKEKCVICLAMTENKQYGAIMHIKKLGYKNVISLV